LVRPFGELINQDGVLDFLKSRRGLLDAIVISGGEPTINTDLPEFLKIIKGLGYKTKLDTNGSNPQVLANLLERHLVDYIALDIKTDPQNYPTEIAHKEISKGVMESINLLKRLGRPHEFRTTVAIPFVNQTIIETIAKMAVGTATLFLQPYRPERILNRPFMDRFPSQPNREDLLAYCNLARKYLPCQIR
jgi:pyruvate formate lyase activating enzyme